MNPKTPTMRPNVNYEPWVIMMCLCTFMNFNKYTTLVRSIDNGGAYACVKAGDTREISVHSAQFCYNPKTAIRNKVY